MRDAKIERIDVRAYRIPTDSPEADGTLACDSTTMVLVTAHSGGERGLGYSYTHASAAQLIETKLGEVAIGRSALAPPAAWQAMVGAVRNFGRQGLVASAISAVDVALWDLKARLLDLPLVSLLGAYREEIPVYGSGGFTFVSGRSAAGAACRLDRRRHPPGQDEGRQRAGSRCRAGACSARRDRAGS